MGDCSNTTRRNWSGFALFLTISVLLVLSTAAPVLAWEPERVDPARVELHCHWYVHVRKYNDVDGDGVCDGAGEPWLDGWTIELYKERSPGHWETQPTQTVVTTSSGNGYVTFPNAVGAGKWKVAEVLESGWNQTRPPSPGYYTFEIRGGDGNKAFTFGNQVDPDCLASVTAVTGPSGDCLQTFTYEVCQTGHALSHWVLGIPSCIVEADILQVTFNGSPYPWSLGLDHGCDPHVYGLKWDNLSVENECALLSVTFKGAYHAQSIPWHAKFATCDCVNGTTLGPSCEPCCEPCCDPPCDDGNPCTIDECVDGVCVYTPIVCDDQDPCTTDECVNGQCVHTATDSDGDGTPDCNDNCPNDPNKTDPGICGCGVADTDSDGDGTPDCNDGCPSDPNKTEPGICGCGVADTDSDGDGTPDCNDNCPAVWNPSQQDTDGDGVGDACDPTCAISGGGDLCEDGTLALEATVSGGTEPYTYVWSATCGSISGSGDSVTFTPHDVTMDTVCTVTLTVTDDNGCVTTCSTMVMVHASPTAGFTAPTVCYCTDTQFTDASTVSSPQWPNFGDRVVPLNAIVAWSWDFDGDGLEDSNVQHPAWHFASSGEHTVKLTVTDMYGCTDDYEATVTIYETPTCDLGGPYEVCDNSTLGLSATVTGGTAPFDYAWSASCGSIGGTGADVTFTPDDVTSDRDCIVTLTVTDANGCVTTCSTTATVHDSPSCSISGADNLCEDGTLSLETDVSGGKEAYAYSWSSTCGGSFSSATAKKPTWTPPDVAVDTLCTILLTVVDANGCTTSCSADFTVHPPPVVTVDDAAVCDGGSATLTATTVPSSGVSYLWSTGETTQSIVVTAEGTYTVIVTINETGCQATDSGTLTVYTGPTADFSNDSPVYLTVPVNFTDLSTAGDWPILSWAWDFGDGVGTSTQQHPSYTYDAVGTYLVTLTVTDEFGCTHTVQRPVTVESWVTTYICGYVYLEGTSVGLPGAIVELEVRFPWWISAGTYTTGSDGFFEFWYTGPLPRFRLTETNPPGYRSTRAVSIWWGEMLYPDRIQHDNPPLGGSLCHYIFYDELAACATTSSTTS